MPTLLHKFTNWLAFCHTRCNIFYVCIIINQTYNYYKISNNNTNHPMSNNSHPSSTANKTRHSPPKQWFVEVYDMNLPLTFHSGSPRLEYTTVLWRTLQNLEETMYIILRKPIELMEKKIFSRNNVITRIFRVITRMFRVITRNIRVITRKIRVITRNIRVITQIHFFSWAQ